VKPPTRWPLHPAPKEGEALSSWLQRIAACYQMDLRELLEHDFGYDQINDLDTAPPMSLLTQLAQRSGVTLDHLRCMSFAGWTPWLLDSLDDRIPVALETYAFQLSVLLPRLRRRKRSLKSWRAWLTDQPLRRACPICLNDATDQAVLLAWKLPLMLSCPLHGCRLELYFGIPGLFFKWENDTSSPKPVNSAIAAMDQRSWQALTTGYVDLPRRHVHAGIWFRFLRTLLDELNTPLSQCGAYAESIRLVWERCEHPVRAGQSLWRCFEVLDPAVQLQMLEAAATAIHMIESGELVPGGEQAELLFLTKPESEIIYGLPVDQQKKKSIDRWQAVTLALNEAILEAQRNPAEARSLFALASYGRRDPASLELLRATFAEMQIPLEFLSHYNLNEPFFMS